MKYRLLILLLGLAAVAASGAEPDLTSPATLIRDAASDPAWKDLFDRLAPGKNRLSHFEERRYFSFRRTPIVLTGEIRISPDRGLSLHYLTPEPRIVIVDRQGLLLRDAHGERALSADSQFQAITALFDVLRFDLPQLQKNFELHGWQEAGVWTLALVPRHPPLAGFLSALVVSGEEARPDKIELIESGGQRIEILIGETQEDVVFTPGELARYFR